MAILRSYSATFEQNALADSAVARYRFNEGSGTDALDSVDGFDGEYQTGAMPGAAGSIGDGAASFDGNSGFVLVSNTLTGTITVSGFGDSLIDGLDVENPSERFTPDLETALDALGLDATVIDHAEGGQQTVDALNPREDRFFTVAEVLADDPDVVILELGTNDALGTIDPETVEDNLREIIAQLQDGGVEQILLTGTFGFYPERTSSNLGYETQAERAEFEGIFADIADDTAGVTLLSDSDGSNMFLGGQRIPGETAADDIISGGVLDDGDPDDLNVDGLHPNAAGVDFIVPRIVPQVVELGAAAGVLNTLELANGSIELWFTPDTIGGSQMLLSKNAGSNVAGDIEILLDDNTVRAAIQNGTTIFPVSGGSVAAGEDTHVVLNFGDGGLQLFVNGLLVDSDPDFTGGLVGNVQELGLGARVDGEVAFDGVIDEVAIYDRALTAGEIEQLFDGGELGSTVIGTVDADTLIGGSDAEDLRGAGGDDTISGNGGDDTLRGGGGTDTLRGGQDDDRLLGGGGADALLGGPGNDTLRGMGGHDSMVGGGGDDLLEGGAGRDTLSGSGGGDELFGGRGIDTLRGGGGDDLLNGGPGPDLLRGGSGSDTFQIDSIGHGVDRIFDFEDGVDGDVLDLSAVLDFGENDNLGDFVQLTNVNANVLVEVDPDGGDNNFSAVFNLIGGAGLDINDLVNDGNINLGAPTS